MVRKKYGAAFKFLTLCVVIGVLLSPMTVYGAGPVNASGFWSQGSEGQWYYYNPDGTMATGWIEIGGKHYYLYEDGHCALNEVTPDGYRVDGSGAWYEIKKDILGVSFPVPARFVPAGTKGEPWTASGEALLALGTKIETAFLKGRKLSVNSDGVEYRSSKSETKYMGLYRDYDSNGYRLDLRIRLEPGSTDENRAATFDYAVFQALLASVSSAPDLLAEAVISSWQDQNAYGISRGAYVAVGDCEVKFEAGDGYGKYFIRPLS